MAAWQEAGYPTESRAAEDARWLEGPCPACGCPADEHAAPIDLVAPI